MAILEIRERPVLRRPLLICGFSGWADAGNGATAALAYLMEDLNPEPCAWLDPEACFDFTVQRPTTRRAPGGGWMLVYPQVQFFALYRPNHERDLLLLTGPEPHLNWPTLTRVIAEFSREVGVETAIAMGVFLGSVSHRSVALVRRTLDPELDQRLARLGCVETGYQGPTGFVTALIHGLAAAGIPAASVWAAAPVYLRAVNPAVAAALLTAIETATQVPLDLGPLQKRAHAFIREVDAMLAANPELANQLREMVDLGPEPTIVPEAPPEQPPPSAQDLPSGQSLVEELERFLRERRGPTEPGTAE
jgi:predicted ATP-grasp superfamily ATP-dependent carboligase